MDDETAGRKFLGDGVDMAASVGGVLVGAAVGGPVGAAAGAAAGPVFKRVAVEAATRAMGRRERARASTVLGMSLTFIKERLDAGEQVRNDDFFDERTRSRSKADEIADGVMMLAQRSHEEHKIPYIAHFLATACFNPRIDDASANWLLRQAENMTWMDFQVLGLARRNSSGDIELPDRNIWAQTDEPLTDYESMITRSFIEFGERAFMSFDPIYLLSDGEVFVESEHRNDPPSLTNARTRGWGGAMSSNFALDTIPISELQPLVETLGQKGRYRRATS
jgi:hypothetical protein